jgi:hypothetical protein
MSETFVTGSPASAMALAVPPVETSSKPRLCSPAAKAVRPVLSETLKRARRMGVLERAYYRTVTSM